MLAKPWEASKSNGLEDAIDAQTHKPWETFVPPVPPKIAEDIRQKRSASGESRPIDKIKAQAFAKAFLVDFNPISAAVRCGLIDEDTPHNAAAKIANRFTRNPYVLQALQAYIAKVETEKLVSRERILMGLLEEANYHGIGASASARVAAWSKLAKLMGMELPPEDPSKMGDQSGVLLIPYQPGGIDEWERAAIGQQQQLKQDVRT